MNMPQILTVLDYHAATNFRHGVTGRDGGLYTADGGPCWMSPAILARDCDDADLAWYMDQTNVMDWFDADDDVAGWARAFDSARDGHDAPQTDTEARYFQMRVDAVMAS